MYVFAIVFITFFFSLFQAHAMIVNGQQVLFEDQTLFFLSLNHSSEITAAQEKQQVAVLLESFKEDQAQQKKKLHVLFEGTGSALKEHVSTEKFLLLDQEIKKRRLSGITVENIEIRDAGNAAFFIFDDPNVSPSLPFYNLGFAHVQEAFNEKKQSQTVFVDGIKNQLIQELCRKKLQQADDEFKKFTKQYAFYDGFSKKIVDLARALSKKESKKLGQLVFNAFAQLLELHIVRRITELETTKRICIIAGEHHLLAIKPLFLENGALLITDRGMPLGHTGLEKADFNTLLDDATFLERVAQLPVLKVILSRNSQ